MDARHTAAILVLARLIAPARHSVHRPRPLFHPQSLPRRLRLALLPTPATTSSPTASRNTDNVGMAVRLTVVSRDAKPSVLRLRLIRFRYQQLLLLSRLRLPICARTTTLTRSPSIDTALADAPRTVSMVTARLNVLPPLRRPIQLPLLLLQPSPRPMRSARPPIVLVLVAAMTLLHTPTLLRPLHLRLPLDRLTLDFAGGKM